MRLLFFKLFVIFLTLLGLAGCKERPQTVSEPVASQITIDTSLIPADSIDAFIDPFRKRLNEVLDAPLSYAPVNITKEGKLNTPLGNLMADLMRDRANAVFQLREKRDVDMALHNFGGMRTAISKGPVSERTAFEVMPFENKLVVVGLPGGTVRKMVDFLIKSSVPHPFSGMQIRLDAEGKLSSVNIGGKPIEDSRVYYIATSDYLVGGGNGMVFFAEHLSLFDTDYKIRNAMIDYFKITDTLKAQRDDRFIQLQPR